MKVSRAVASSPEGLAERIAPWVAGFASLWFGLAAGWGMFGPITAGHYGTMGGEGIIGENMVRWHILGPVWNYVTTPPTPNMYYCHHPWGGFWIMGIVSALFGHHNVVLPLPAVLMSAATPPLLYGIARDAWGKVSGAAAAVGFSFLPITLAFANFHNVEVTVLFACTLFFWGHARMLATWRWRYLLASLAGATLAASSDWPAYVMVATLLSVSLLRGFLLPGHWIPARSFRRYALWWALSVTTSIAMLTLFIALFARSEKLIDWLSAGSSRGGGSVPLEQALAGRKTWIETSFTPPVIVLGKLTAPLAVLRLIWRRRDEEAYSLSLLTGASASYVVFKQAADVHVFWSHYFGGYFALALAQLVASLGDVLRFIERVAGSPGVRRVARALPLVVTVIFAAMMLPDAVRTLRYARETGGRFNQNGHPISSESNIVEVLWRLKSRLPPFTGPDVMSPQMAWSWAYGWASQGDGRDVAAMPTEHAAANDPHPIFMTRAGGLTLEQQRSLATAFHLEVYDDEVWVIDRRLPAAPLEAYTFEEREPRWWEWYFISGVEPVRKYALDPYKTWEWRTHMNQPVELPATPPRTSEQFRIAHNIAVAAGDAANAAALRARLEGALDRGASTRFTEGLSLLGVQRVQGTQPRIVLLFEATGTPASDATFAVHAVVERTKRVSLIPPDTLERQVSLPAAMSTRAYRPGFIYSHTVVLRQRIGVERFWGMFESKNGSLPPVRVDGAAETPLLTLE